MKLNLYAILDVKAQAYRFMHFLPNHGEAIRSFGDAVRTPKSSLHQHPEDYSLYHLGWVDDESGYVESLRAPVYLSRASEFVANLTPTPAMEASNENNS